ncbi:hypothetical protein N7493_006440 [Penicillium malachiteum]|uniref:FAD/NAD(P)-binding domain-containing protein n=1 Tax=Penicillium malachiteum TaxID=1324776 RepID=A0AAD6MVI9_9EURO|nr:hypothetical protein N7493_006440 [Penicillium malachiteum]
MAIANVQIQPSILSKDRIEPGSTDIPLGILPKTSTLTPEDPDGIVSALITKLNEGIAKKDNAAVAAVFIENSYWRDHLCLSWAFRTLKGSESLSKFAVESPSSVKLEIDRSSPMKAPHVGPIDAFGEVNGLESFVKVTASFGTGTGVVRIAQQGDEWKLFTVFTTLLEITNHEEVINERRPAGVQHGAYQGRQNWQDRRNEDINQEGKDPAVVIVGAGQGGLTAAARLKMLNVDTLLIDQEDRIGDSWRRRYHQLVLHDPVWYDHLPYLPFPPNWPIFTPKDKLADFFESYVKILELNVWVRTKLKSTSWDESTRQWTIVVERTKADGSVEIRTLHPRHVIQATGHSGKKNLPDFKGMESFKGDRICHSSDFTGAKDGSKGKKAIVVGSCNSGHDIAQDFYEKGYDVTMVQRSSTCVVSSKSITEIALKALYSEAAPPTEDADTYLVSIAPELFKLQQTKVDGLMRTNDAQTLEGLEKAGFKVDRGPMDAGLMIKYFQRGGGYYIDVGGSQLIIDGKVKVKHGQEISEILSNGIRFADGSELVADEIIFATGYQNMRTQARIIFGDAVADRVDDVWGLNHEGEFRTIWQRSGHPGFWFMGGNLALCRYYSRLLALQIKALEEGIAQY